MIRWATLKGWWMTRAGTWVMGCLTTLHARFKRILIWHDRRKAKTETGSSPDAVMVMIILQMLLNSVFQGVQKKESRLDFIVQAQWRGRNAYQLNVDQQLEGWRRLSA